VEDSGVEAAKGDLGEAAGVKEEVPLRESKSTQLVIKKTAS